MGVLASEAGYLPLFGIAVVGFFVGCIGGLLGVGGGVILIPALTEAFGPNQHLYQAAAMILYVFVASTAVRQHARAKLIDKQIVLRIAPPAMVAVIGGVALSEIRLFSHEGERYLRLIFGVFLIACGVYDLYRTIRQTRAAARNELKDTTNADTQYARLTWRNLLLIAIPTGFYTGFLGVGGGIVAVPLQRRFLGLPIRNAIANSSAIMIATSGLGALLKNYAYISDTGSYAPIRLAAILIPTAILGSFIGSRGTTRLPIRVVRFAFIAVLLASGIRMTQGAWPAATP